MLATVNHIIRRCREEGAKNSCRFVLRRIQAPLLKRFLYHKYIHYKALSAGQVSGPREGCFFFNSETLASRSEFFNEHYPQERNTILQMADCVLNHDFTWLCPNAPIYDTQIEWTSNFTDHRKWPSSFYAELDYASDDRPGDVRELWELNRHQYFITLGKAYALTGDERYVEEFFIQFNDWVERNPVGYGINWLDAQEVAIRAVSWCWAYHFFRNAVGFNEQFRQHFLSALYTHAEYVRWHLSDKPITHNHLVTEACSLAIVGYLFPSMPGATLWRERGVKIFLREVVKQVWEDGIDAELSTNYHCFVLDSFLQLSLLMQVNKRPVPTKVLSRIESMIQAVMFFQGPDGSLPLIGDNDNGRAMRLTEQNPDDRRAYLAIGAVMFGRGDFKQVAGHFYEEAFWMLGVEGWRLFNDLEGVEPQDTDKPFLPAGLLTARTEWGTHADSLVFRGGPIEQRKGVSISHNHADLLSFVLTLDGQPVLVDPGVYLYGKDDRWRFYFRRTLAHNTVVVDGLDQFVVSATRFGIQDLPLSVFCDFSSDRQHAYFDMAHTGYDKSGVRHRRRLFWEKTKFILVIDEFEGEGSHTLDVHWHFSPQLTVCRSKSLVTAKDGSGKPVCTLQPIGTLPDSVRIERAETDNLQGWVAERYGCKRPAPVVVHTARRDFPHRQCTFFDLQPQSSQHTVTVDSSNEGIVFHVCDGKAHKKLSFNVLGWQRR